MPIQEKSVQDLAELQRQQSPYCLLDVREEIELSKAAVSGALHIPMREVRNRVAELPSDRPIFVMCHHGGRSARITEYLSTIRGLTVFNLIGGIDAWSREIDRTIPQYD